MPSPKQLRSRKRKATLNSEMSLDKKKIKQCDKPDNVTALAVNKKPNKVLEEKSKAKASNQKEIVQKYNGQELKEVDEETQKERKVVRNMYVGAHTSIAGGLHNAVLEAVEIKANAFALFLKSQRQWASKPLEDDMAEKFKEVCLEHGYSSNMILPHGSYLMNCGSPNEEIFKKSKDMLVDELKRCEKLGLTLFNFHPGSTCGKISREEAIEKIASCINHAHSETKNVIAVIENMSCQGNTIGGKFEELQQIIDKIKIKSRIGVCLDTCHAFAAGYNIQSEDGYEKMMSDFEKIVGLKYLKALHINDSKGDCGCHLDRHENIGNGKIDIASFRRIMNDDRLKGLPLILETPQSGNITWKKEIQILYNLCKE